MNFWNTPQFSLKKLLRRKQPQLRQIRHFRSEVLGREMLIDVWLPPYYDKNKEGGYPLVVFNDGQDLYPMQLEATLARLYKKKLLRPIIAVGIHANHDRMREYGTVNQADYKGRGDKAGLYQQFLITEFLPLIFQRFHISGLTSETVLAGFSLGGLSAFDIAYSNPQIFGVCGVFSGALWWRFEPFDHFRPDAGRIIQDKVHNGREWDEQQRFWFQCGEFDETSDRNNNGVIDAIDDTLDLIRALKMKGHPDQTIRYLEMQGGRHDQKTWGQALPDFLLWAFSTQYEFQD